MPLVNVAYNISFGWSNPELQSLEAQMMKPLFNEHPVELGLAGRQSIVCDVLAAEPEYREAFARAFPRTGGSKGSGAANVATVPTADANERAHGESEAIAMAVDARGAPMATAGSTVRADSAISIDNVVKAVAAFERTLIFGDSPFDRYVFGGEHDALSAQAKRGMRLFYSPKAGCAAYHSGFNFNGNWRDAQGDTGKPAFANNGVGERPMRIPTLRNIAVAAPYMHDGRFATLDAMLAHYAHAAQLPGSDDRLRTFNLSADERAELIAFLQALTDAEFSGR
jgi:cytochrome c peroxidase